MKTLITFTVVLAVFLSACAPIVPAETGVSTPIVITAEAGTVDAVPVGPVGTEAPFPTSEPPTAIPTLPSSKFSPTELKYKVLEQFPDFFFCDPDYFPIARNDEMALAQQRFPELQADQEKFQAILKHNGFAGFSTFTDDQKLLIYREYKKLNAIYFELSGDKFQFQIQTGTEGQEGFVIHGAIDGNGSIDVQQRDPGFPACPICLTEGTLIDTPRGALRVEDLQVGDPVWTANEAGERVSAVILKAGSVRVSPAHQIIHMILSDGRELWASPGHPLVDGHMLADLKAGDLVDGASVSLIEYLSYDGNATHDILPSGGTGYYWANGILIGSSMRKP